MLNVTCNNIPQINVIIMKVAEWSNEPQGVILPPALPNGFGEYWYSEGGACIVSSMIIGVLSDLNYILSKVSYRITCPPITYIVHDSLNIVLLLQI